MKRCELGQKCPYQGQRQHLQEYYHSSNIAKRPREEPMRPTAPTAPRTLTAQTAPRTPTVTSTAPTVTPRTLTAQTAPRTPTVTSTAPTVTPRTLTASTVTSTAPATLTPAVKKTVKRKNPVRKARLAPAATINEQNDAYQETLALDALRKEEEDMLAAIEISKQLIERSDAEERANTRKQLEDQEPKTSPIIIQFRSPASAIVIKRHFLPSDEWKDVVYRFVQCQEFGQTWKLIDPVDPSNPIIQTTSSQVKARDGTVSDYGLSKLSFIIDLDD